MRELERTLARVARKAAVEMLEQKTEEITVTQDKLTAYLGQPRYTREPLEKENRVGVVNGLAYTSVGGEMLSVECAVLKGTGALQLTGKLGDVMQESAKAALSWVRAHCDPWGVPADFFKQNDIHIHVPEGAVPKDGPSAGVTLVTALVSALTSIPVRQNVAMTGEITLRGRVLPIGGLKEKLMAAYRAGVRTVLIPRENLKDLEDVSPTVRERIDIRPVDDVAEVIRAALVCEPPVIADTPLELPLTAPQPAKPACTKEYSMEIKTASFVTSLAQYREEPPVTLPQLAVVGKSNVGKSSLINALCARKKLCKTSATPGKTRLINIFLINEAFHLVDLPGYGFAKVNQAEKQRWGEMMDDYFQDSTLLRHVLLLVDIRHEPTRDDVAMAQYFRQMGIPFTVVATKADKISRGARMKHIAPHLPQRFWCSPGRLLPFRARISQDATCCLRVWMN